MNLQRLTLAVGIAALGAVLPAHAFAEGPSPSRKSIREIVMMPVVLRAPGMDRVAVTSNVRYTSAPDTNLLMDVYTPPNLAQGERRPAVIFVHGGAGSALTPKDWGIYVSWGKLVAASGLVGVTFTHRLGYPNPQLANASADLDSAIQYVRSHANSLHVDPDRIALIAYSAGGPLLSRAMREHPKWIRCLGAFYAFLDIQQSETHRTHERPETIERFAPILTLGGEPAAIPPIFVARAGRDEIPTMNDSIDRFVREALTKNITITFMNHPQGVHGFDNQNDDARSREILKSALAFLHEHLSPAGQMP